MLAHPGSPREVASVRRRDLVALAGGIALLVSPLLPWVRRGPGHTLSGREMIDAVVALGRTLPGLSAARLALVWYLVPAVGALVWVAVGLDRARRAVAVAALVVPLAAVIAFVRLVGVGGLGEGAGLALVGALAAAGALLGRTHARGRDHADA